MQYGYGTSPNVSLRPLSNYASQETMSYSLLASWTITTSCLTPTVERTSAGTSGQSRDIGHNGRQLSKPKKLYENENKTRRCSHGSTLILQ